MAKRGHPFSTYAKFFEKLTFLSPNVQLLHLLLLLENQFSDIFRMYENSFFSWKWLTYETKKQI